MPHYGAVERDTAGLDQALGVTPRSHPCARHKFGDAFLFHCCDIIGQFRFSERDL